MARGNNSNVPRIILYCVAPPAYQLLRDWAARTGYDFCLIVTTPGPIRARTGAYRAIINEAPAEQDILITTRMRGIAPLIAAAHPDLILSFTFPFRIPPDVLALPRHGAVNLHPAPLPAYRGPEPARMIYNGEPNLGATLHRTEAEFDTGPVLSVHTAPIPDNVTKHTILATWHDLIMKTLDEGIPRALADEPGAPQESSKASYAASFTEEDLWLDWQESAHVLQRRATAVNLFRPQAKAMVDGRAYLVSEVSALPDADSIAQPGTMIEWSHGMVKVRTASGIVQMKATRIT